LAKKFIYQYDKLSLKERKELENRKLKDMAAFAYNNSPAYRELFDSKQIKPENIDSFEKLKLIPVTKKSKMPYRQKENPPFGGFLAADVKKLKRIYISPGPIYDAEGRADDYWGLKRCCYHAGFKEGDIVMNTFSYHLTPAGIFLDEACGSLGCVMVPTGVGNTEIQARAIVDLKINGYIGVPDFLLTLYKKGEELGYKAGYDLKIEKALVSGAPLSSSLRKELKKLGISVKQSYITADLGGVAYECEEEEGFHISDRMIIEIVDPKTGMRVKDGETGEVVVTVLENKTYPLIRYGTGDLSAFIATPCRCGRTSKRLKGILGRADDVPKIRGMFVHPVQVEELFKKFPEVKKYRVLVDREDERDLIKVEIETGTHEVISKDDLLKKLKTEVKEILKLRADEIEFVSDGTIPDGAKIIEDRRKWD